MRNIQIGGRSFMATLHKPLPAHIAAVAAANPGILQAFERGDAALQAAAARRGLAVPRPERASAPANSVGAPAPNSYGRMSPMEKHRLWRENPRRLVQLQREHDERVEALQARLASATTHADYQRIRAELAELGG